MRTEREILLALRKLRRAQTSLAVDFQRSFNKPGTSHIPNKEDLTRMNMLGQAAVPLEWALEIEGGSVKMQALLDGLDI